MDTSRLDFSNYSRCFGVEIEVNALDGRDFITFPLSHGELPEGIQYIGELLSRLLYEPISIQSWHYTHDNSQWVLKSDRSCGIELCSPVSNRLYGLNQICEVIGALNRDPRILIDKRCSLHVHVNVEDCSSEEVASILAYWIKSEPVFIDLLPNHRKLSRYFQFIGACSVVSHAFGNYLILERLLGEQKYMTINTYHKYHGNRQTIEFRIMGHEGCKSVEVARNWMVLVLHFVEQAKKHGLPRNHGNEQGLLWMEPRDVMELLGFTGDYELSEELSEARKWFVSWLKKNTGRGQGLWSMKARDYAHRQVNEIAEELRL
jgi:hypothetical protein